MRTALGLIALGATEQLDMVAAGQTRFAVARRCDAPQVIVDCGHARTIVVACGLLRT
jgi:hypothetical protein